MMKTNLAQNTILLSMGTFLTKGINLLMIPLFSSWLSTEDYGSFDLFCTYVSLMIPFITMSSSDAIFRFSVDKEKNEERIPYITAGFTINFVNTIIVSVVLLFIQAFTGWKFAIPFMVLLISELMNNHIQGFMRATKQLKLYSLSSVISTLGIAGAVTTLVLKCQLGLYGMIYGYAIGYIIGEIFLIFLTKYWRYLNLTQLRLSTIKELIAYAYPLIPNNISWWIINVSDRTLINLFLGASSNGIFAIAYKIPNFCASIFNVFNISWQEVAVEFVDSEERNTYYNSVYNSTVKTMISLCGGLISSNYFLFSYIFDQRYYEARLYSPILVSSVIFGSLTLFFGGIQISLKRTKENGVTTMTGALVNVVINMALIKYIGLYAAAISTIVANIVITLIRYIRLNKDIEFKLTKSSWSAITYYNYMLIMCYICNSLLISIINLIIAIVAFGIINKNFVFGFLRKLKIMK